MHCYIMSKLCKWSTDSPFSLFAHFRILGKLQMKQIGRHFYNPSQSTTIPQHKYAVLI